jgi:hypothetical protein
MSGVERPNLYTPNHLVPMKVSSINITKFGGAIKKVTI